MASYKRRKKHDFVSLSYCLRIFKNERSNHCKRNITINQCISSENNNIWNGSFWKIWLWNEKIGIYWFEKKAKSQRNIRNYYILKLQISGYKNKRRNRLIFENKWRLSKKFLHFLRILKTKKNLKLSSIILTCESIALIKQRSYIFTFSIINNSKVIFWHRINEKIIRSFNTVSVMEKLNNWNSASFKEIKEYGSVFNCLK